MKRFLLYVLLLVSLTACSGASSQSTFECNKKEEVCIYIKVDEPIVGGEPVNVTVTIKGEKDIPDLQAGLSATGNVYFEEPSLKTWKKTDIGWKVKLQPKKLHIFKHKVLFPIGEGFYYVGASVGTPNYGEIASYSVRISISGKQGKAYYPGTAVPNSDGSVIMPVITFTPGPSPTPTPTPSYP